MFFDNNGLINIDEMVTNHPEWKKIMADGIVTQEEVANQAQRVTDLLHDIDNSFSETQKKTVETLLSEMSVLFAAYHVNAIQNIPND